MTAATYHRPDTVDQAMELLNAGGAVPLAGGTALLASATRPVVSMVDLQALGLDHIRVEEHTAALGAMVRLSTIADHEGLPGLIRDTARAELPSTLRTLATVGGTVASSDPDSALLGALLAFGAQVHLAGGDSRPLAATLGQGLDRGDLVESISFPITGETTRHAVGRTPGDAPIVGVYGRTDDGTTTLAATGVASHPVLVDPGDLDALDPPGDFRGTAPYRRHLAHTLVGRAVADLGS